MSKIIKSAILLIYVGIISGVLSSAFLYSLKYVTALRIANPLFILGLPVFGFMMGILIKRIPSYINQGVPYIVKEIDHHEEKVSTLTAPFIFITSIGTHLFGGSVGREGVGVLMGASAAHILPKASPLFKRMRVQLIYAGIAAGFSAMFGTPLAALIFAFEIHRFKEIKKFDLFFTTMLAALIADRVTRYFGPHHYDYQVFFNWDLTAVWTSLLVGILSGIGAFIFFYGTKYVTKIFSKFIPRIEWKLFVGGAIVVAIIFLFDAFDYTGIGTHMIKKSFTQQMLLSDFFLKCILTIITISVGFKGGEVTPLFFMGATLSNSCLGFFNLKNFSLNSSLGMAALFGAVTNTPVASTIMACELFGWRIGLFALLSCFTAKLFLKNKSIYGAPPLS